MLTDTHLLHDHKRNLFFICFEWQEGIPPEYEKVHTFDKNPFGEFRQVLGTGFGGTMYEFKNAFIAINYPERPKFCRWVLFKKEDGQTLDDVMIFVCELADIKSLP